MRHRIANAMVRTLRIVRTEEPLCKRVERHKGLPLCLPETTGMERQRMPLLGVAQSHNDQTEGKEDDYHIARRVHRVLDG